MLVIATAMLGVLAAAIGLIAGRSPELALAAAAMIIFLSIALVNLSVGVAVFTALVFLEAILPAGATVSLHKVIGGVLVHSWFATVATSRSEADQTFFTAHPRGTVLLVAFLGWMAMSISWAGDSGAAIDSFSRYALNVMLFVVVFTAAKSRRHISWVIGAYIFGVLVTAVYGLVARPEDSANEAFRLSGSVGDPNELAAVLVTGIALALAAACATRSGALRSSALVVVALSLISVVLTGSRGGVLALAAALLAAVIFAGRWRPQVFALAMVLVVTGVTFFAAFAPQDIRDRLSRVDPAQDNIAEEGRATIWQVGWRIATDNPVAGVGIGNFQDASRNYVLEPGQVTRTEQVLDREQGPHNMYLGMFTETGVIGMALFVAVLVMAMAAALKAARTFERTGDWRMEMMARALVVALVGACVAGFFSTHDVAKWLWVLLALGPAMLTVAQAAPVDTRPSEPAEGEPVRSARRSPWRRPATAPGG